MTPKASTILLVAATALTCTVGSAFAAATITGAQIRNGSITGADIKSASIPGLDVQNSSLTGLDVKNGTLGAADLSAAARAEFAKPGVNGTNGSNGVNGTDGRSSWDSIPSGQTVVGSFFAQRPNDLAGHSSIVVNLPGRVSKTVGAGNISFAPAAVAGDADDRCTGTVAAPTAPAGQICIYASATGGVLPGSAKGFNDILLAHGFRIAWDATAANQDFSGTWAYTAL